MDATDTERRLRRIETIVLFGRQGLPPHDADCPRATACDPTSAAAGEAHPCRCGAEAASRALDDLRDELETEREAAS